MTPRKTVKVDYPSVFFVTVLASFVLWLLPMLLGKYADTSYPYIAAADISKEVLTVTQLETLNRQATGAAKPQAGTKRPLPPCPEVSPHLRGLQLDYLQQDKLPWTDEAVAGFATTFRIQPGGFWEPSDCTARYAATIVVGQRNRTAQLHRFLLHMHPFLARQQVRYRIVVVQQNNTAPYNRGKLFNIGYKESQLLLSAGVERHCVILHDVDLLPLSDLNLYACTRQPRHLSVAVDTFRFQLPYRILCGGAMAVLAEQFEAMNGFSNSFSGWGAEDDDFCTRVYDQDLDVVRFAPSVAMYTMLPHAPTPPSRDRFATVESSSGQEQSDGLSSLYYTRSVVQQPLALLVTANW